MVQGCRPQAFWLVSIQGVLELICVYMWKLFCLIWSDVCKYLIIYVLKNHIKILIFLGFSLWDCHTFGEEVPQTRNYPLLPWWHIVIWATVFLYVILGALQSLFKWWSWVDLWPASQQGQLCSPMLLYGKCLNTSIEVYELKVSD